MRPALLLLLSSFCLLAGTSCLRTSTVVRVKKDGSGSIISRYHFSPQMMAMVGQLGAFGGGEEGPSLGMILEIATPDEDSLKKDAANFGEGVHYSRHEPGKDEDGWEGYVVVYDFEDIRKVRIDQNSVPGKAKEFAESSGQEIKGSAGGSLSFALEGDLLTVKSNLANAGVEGLVTEEQFDQAKQLGMPPSEAMKMAAGMSAGMRVGVFLRAEEGIVETTAEHVTGDLIIINDTDITKVISDPDFGAFLDKAMEDRAAVTEDSLKELFKKLEAMTFEPSDEFTVKLK